MRQPSLALAAVFLFASACANAQTGSPIQRTVITRGDVSVPGREAVVAQVEIAPGALAGRHTHPGDEISYFLGGEGELLIDGQPPRRMKAGEAFVIPAGVVHAARNPGTEPARLVGVYIVEKGQPLATPAK
jgi:quercetin dioxygenase-like cupin family protein